MTGLIDRPGGTVVLYVSLVGDTRLGGLLCGIRSVC